MSLTATFRISILTLVGTCAPAAFLCSQLVQNVPQDALKQDVPSIELSNETIVDGLAKLNQATTDVAFSIEFPLGRTISDPAPSLSKVAATIQSGSLRDSLDRLCRMDPTFVWQRIGNTVHLLPRVRENDPTYFPNRNIEALELRGATGAQDAIFQSVERLSGPKEQIAVMQTGMSLSFVQPWYASFKNITIRELLDKIGQQLGTTYGWQLSGATDFRLLVFHQRLQITKPVRQP